MKRCFISLFLLFATLACDAKRPVDFKLSSEFRKALINGKTDKVKEVLIDFVKKEKNGKLENLAMNWLEYSSNDKKFSAEIRLALDDLKQKAKPISSAFLMLIKIKVLIESGKKDYATRKIISREIDALKDFALDKKLPKKILSKNLLHETQILSTNKL